MRINLLYTVLFVLLFPAIVIAQENEHRIPREYNSPGIQPPSEEVFKELNNLVEEEYSPTRFAPSSPLPKDSMVSKSYSNPVHRGKSNNDQQRNSDDNSKSIEKEKDGSNSILSFNFIYYFFRKFKLSDIVDENR